ncbi:MAG: phosphotransferase [Oscillospiraceae bacterium]|nr:phosphotransferase [Oscillospiraceae bacterium]
MHKRDWVVLAVIANYGYLLQREIVKRTSFSLGAVNASLKSLQEEGYLDEHYALTKKAKRHIEATSPRRAVILSAGPGLRMAPLNGTPKGLLKIGGEALLDRMIQQLQLVGIREIYVVVGYMMERFEYLAEEYGVNFIFNDDYASGDSLRSLCLAGEQLENCYVVNSDLWFARNPFSKTEFFPWYAVSEMKDAASFVRINKKMELVNTGDSAGNAMVGLCYLTADAAEKVRANLQAMRNKRQFAKAEWESALMGEDKMLTYARVMRGQNYFAVKTYEQLLELQEESDGSMRRRKALISRVMEVPEESVTDISIPAKGMTNRALRFCVRGKPYILRIPGEGSEKLTDRRREAEVYGALKGLGISDEPVYIDVDTGYKISPYVENSHTCDPWNESEVRRCIVFLKRFHQLKLRTEGRFEPFRQIERYEALVDAKGLFLNYEEIRRNVMSLESLLLRDEEERFLCHIDAVPENFLICENGTVRLIDWEYAGVSDPVIDVAAFCISAGYDSGRIKELGEIYTGRPDEDFLRRLYGYCAVLGLLWTLWSEYKRMLGVVFPCYVMKQYRYARRYALLAKEMFET